MTEKTEREELVKRLQARLVDYVDGGYDIDAQLARDAIAALTAQPQGEPVLHMHDADLRDTVSHEYWLDADDRSKEWFNTPLYTAPQPGVREGMLRAALDRLVKSQLSVIPRYEAGQPAQDAWADERASAIKDAEYALYITRTVEELKVNAEGVSHGHS